MKQYRNKNRVFRVCLLILIFALVSGCGKEDSAETNETEVGEAIEQTDVEESSDNVAETVKEEDSLLEATGEEESNEEEAVHVDNVADFLEAIKPGATIVWEPGYYNFSEYTDEVWSKQKDLWNESHTYVRLEECFDGGVEVVIQNVDSLSILGDIESAIPTELVVKTRYGEVLGFENCHQIFLSGLTMGHTDEGTCMESVLSFSGSEDIHLSAMDLYGCGMYGFTADNGSGDIYLQSSTIRECEGGPFYIYDTKGTIEFRDCWLKDSNSGGYYEDNEETELSFYECNFGQYETNMWMFRNDVTCVDCIFEEVTEYPDVEPEPEYYLDIDSLKLMPLDGNVEGLADTYYAYMIVDQQSGDTVYYPYFYLQLSEDGTGYLESENDNFDFIWYYEADGMLTLEGDSCYYYLTPYIEQADGYDRVWLMMQMYEDVIWLY